MTYVKLVLGTLFVACIVACVPPGENTNEEKGRAAGAAAEAIGISLEAVRYMYDPPTFADEGTTTGQATGCTALLYDTTDLCGLTYSDTIAWDWTNCPIGESGSTTGSISMTNTLDLLPTGSDCTTATGRSWAGTFAYDVNAINDDDSTVDRDGSVTIASQSPVTAEPPSEVSLSMAFSSVDVDAAGTTTRDSSTAGDITAMWDGANDFTIDASLVVTDMGASVTNLSATGLSFTAGCCYPTGGSTTLTDSAGAVTAINWGPQCGQVRLGIFVLNLNPCPTGGQGEAEVSN